MKNVTAVIGKKIVINTASKSATLGEIFQHISYHIESWKDKNIIWILTDFDFDRITKEDFNFHIDKSKGI